MCKKLLAAWFPVLLFPRLLHLFQLFPQRFGKRPNVPRPPAADEVTVRNDECRRLVKDRVPAEAGRLEAVMGGGEGHVEEIGGTREETGHLTLDTHVAGCLTWELEVSAIVLPRVRC